MNTELFHDSSNNCYATFTNKGHRECWELESSGFRDWLSYMFFLETRGAPSETALNAALGTLSGQAKFEGPERKVFRRVAKDGEALWIDLCDEEWKQSRSSRCWKVVEDPPVIFVRSQTMNFTYSIRKGGLRSFMVFNQHSRRRANTSGLLDIGMLSG